MDYSELDMHPDLAKGVIDAGYVTCMPVQAAVFPHAFIGEDIYAQSQTGTGKTAAFLISIFQRIMKDDASRHRKVLILAPTRELAVQIEAEAEKLGKHLPIRMGCFYGGVAYGPQFDMLRDNVQMIIGTPGRIIDLIEQGKMLLRDVGFLVVDEADRMFDMGFIDDLRKLLRYLPPPKERQTFLFSATLNFRIKNLAWEYMDEPKEIVIDAETVTVDLVQQELYHVGSDEKFRVLLGLLARDRPASALIFCNQKFMAEEVSRRLGINGFECEYIMGDLPQAKRLQVIERLKAGNLAILVATDVAARGLDVNALDLVVNYDVPMEPESYIHRIGRTARAGATGKAITLACEKFVYGLPAIEKYIEMKIPVCPVSEELFGIDKSSGLRFGHARDRARPGSDRTGGRSGMSHAGTGHGDRHGRPGQDRGAPRGAPSRGGRDDRGQGRRPYGEMQPVSRDSDMAAEQARLGKLPRSPQPGKPGKPAEQARPIAQGGRDPYAVSSDERMKRYKDKYSAGQGQSAPEGARTQSGLPGRRQERQPERRPDRQAGQRPQQPGRQGPPPKAGSAKGTRSSKPARKPGLLDKLKRMLGIDKGSD
ncbi:MAG: RNA helicase [Spirochaetae bacterium HGW-Spirochaetae-7]|nr:MAG: RNA helicase [Spirochaetae bacterium HGW-Spirochaetae-7]